VVLETDGTFTMLNDSGQTATTARQDVAGYPVR
jgi:hypothetical protein